MTTFEIFQNFGELPCSSPRLEPENPAHDMVGPGLVGWVRDLWVQSPVRRVSPRPWWIGPQMKVWRFKNWD